MNDLQPTIVLAISRQLGSGGSLIGREVATQLGFRFFDRDILHQAAESLGLDEAGLAPLEERSETFWDRLAPTLPLGVTGGLMMPTMPLYTAGSELFAAERGIIQSLAARESAVIVGRGGVHVLSGHPGLVAVFVHAPESFRVRRLMETMGIATVEEAENLVRRSDKQRSEFHKSLTRHQWTDASMYDLCVNSAAVGLEKATEVVVAVVAARVGAGQRSKING